MGEKTDIQMPSKAVLKDLADSVGVEIYHYYSWNMFVKSVFRKRLKTAVALANPVISMRVLDLGCGASFLSYNLARKGTDTVALDLYVDLRYVKSVMAKLVSNKIHFIKGDGTNLPFKSNSFDVVFALDVLEHIESLHQAIDEVQRILKYGAIFIVSLPYENNFSYRLGKIFSKEPKEEHNVISIMQKIKAPHLNTLSDVINVLREHFIQEKKSDIPFFPKIFSVASYRRF